MKWKISRFEGLFELWLAFPWAIMIISTLFSFGVDQAAPPTSRRGQYSIAHRPVNAVTAG